MAAYAATVSLSQRVISKIGHNLGVLHGSVNITNYNPTLAAITGITKYFKGGAPIVVLDGVSSNGYVVKWHPASKAVKAYYPSVARTHAHDTLVKGGQAAATTSRVATYATNILGKEEATDVTIAKADTATKGGVISEALAAAAGSEVVADVDVGTVNFIAFGVA